MSLESLLIIVLIGAIAGWLAGLIMKGGGFGLLGDIVVGIIGAFVGSYVLGKFGASLGGGWLGAIFTATIGAVLVLALIRVLRRL